MSRILYSFDRKSCRTIRVARARYSRGYWAVCRNISGRLVGKTYGSKPETALARAKRFYFKGSK